MADIDHIDLNGTQYSILDATSRAGMQTNAQAIAVIQQNVANKQDKLTFSPDDFDVSADNEISLKTGAALVIDSALSQTSTNPVQNRVISANLLAKQDRLRDSETVTLNPDGSLEAHITVDEGLSATSTNPVQNKTVQAAVAQLATDVQTVTQAADSNTTAIAKLNSNKTVEGSVDYKIDQAIGDIDFSTLQPKTMSAPVASATTVEGALNTIESQVIALDQEIGDSTSGVIKAVADNTTAISALETTVGNASSGLVKSVADNSTAIATNTSAIATINGTDTGSSMRDVAEDVVSTIPKAITPKGTIAFANLPTLADSEVGDMYNIEDAFTTTADFIMGAGTSMSANSNVYVIDAGSGTKKWDVFATGGIADMSAYQTKTLTSHTGITATTVETALEEVASTAADNASDISDLKALVPSTASATNKLVTEQGFTKTQLTNEDLNEILTQGYYYTNGADSVTNKPADNLANWELEVSAFGGRVIQIFTCGNSIYNAPTSGIVFYRVYGISGLAWSEWRQLATDSDLASLQSDISDNATAISTLDTTVAGLRTIRNLDASHSGEQGLDLNDFKGESNTITTYWFRYASGFSNIPTPTFGSFDWLLLTVENASNRVQQTALLQKANNQAERWTRAFVYADVSGKTEWSSWKKIVTDDDSLPVKIVNLRGTAAEPTDLNSVASNYQNMLVSVYYGEAGAVVNTPVTSHCAVFQFRHVSNPNYLTQICFPVSSNKMYIRYCASGTWHDWVDIATDKLFIENWVNPDTDYFTAVNGIAVASVNPGRLPSIGVPDDYSTYGTFITLGGSNYKTALYIDVFGNLATWGSNQKQWYKVQMKSELTVTYGTWTIDGTYCTDGSISWYKYGRVVVVTLSYVKFSSWTGADHIITTNAGPKSMVAVGASILPINSAEAPQLIAIRTDGKITTQGSISHSGTFFGSFTYITAE